VEIISTAPAARQHSPAHLVENYRATGAIVDQAFRVETRSDAGTTYLDDEHCGTFASVIRHAMTCARSIRSRFELREAACDVTDASGQLVYSVSAVTGGLRVRSFGEAL